MGNEPFSDLEKQELLQIIVANGVIVPGLERIVVRIAESVLDTNQRQVAVAFAAQYLALRGSHDDALALVDRYLKGVTKARALASIASGISATSPQTSSVYLERTYQLLREAADPDDQMALLQQLVRQHLEFGQSREAWEIARLVSPPSERSYTLCQVAKHAWEANDRENTGRIIVDARRAAEQATAPDRADAWDSIARLFLYLGREAEAVDAWENAIKFSEDSQDPSKLLLAICKELAAIGRKERAKEVAQAIRNEARRVQALSLVDG